MDAAVGVRRDVLEEVTQERELSLPLPVRKYDLTHLGKNEQKKKSLIEKKEGR